jgi:ABC-2 type transport system permease protein
MSASGLEWLRTRSDLLSPILVKEVRQMVRGRDFAWAFAGSLLVGVAVAFVGAAEALGGNTVAGRSTFLWLLSCLAIIALAVIPLGAFSALRSERMEQTLDLMMLTALSPRRVIIGKLLAQAVKLTTLLAAVAPFLAMSFLLGGVDFVSILVALASLFVASLWMSALGLFLSTLLKSRAMSGLFYGGMALVVLLLLTLTRSFYLMLTGFGISFYPATGRSPYWTLGVWAVFCLATMTNLVLLAENRLALAVANRVTPVRVGFFVQFVLICAATMGYAAWSAAARFDAVETLGVAAGLHLALVAMFVLTEDIRVPQNVQARVRASRWGHPALAIFRPGAGAGALYVATQMALLLLAARLLDATASQYRWLLAICAYICLFSGLPALVLRTVLPRRSTSLHLRTGVLVALVLALVLPDVLHYLLWQPDVLSLTFARRHLINPFRTITNWQMVEKNAWFAGPAVFGLTGAVSYLWVILASWRAHRTDATRTEPAGAPDEQTRVDVAG